MIKSLPKGTPTIVGIGKKTKPSGMPARGYENISKPTEVPAKKVKQIEHKVEQDFKAISEKIIKEAPIEETHTALKNDKTYKEVAQQSFRDVETLAEQIPQKIHTKTVKKAIVDQVMKSKGTGFTPSEYDKTRLQYIKQFLKETPEQEITARDLVAQYRKNNKELSEAFDPIKSGGYNRGKKEALLDYNRALAETIHKQFPDSEFANLFKESNERWTKIMDAEAIDKFIGSIFKDGIKFDKAQKLLDKEGMKFPFKRALGEKGYKNFETLLNDLIDTKTANRMLIATNKSPWPTIAKQAIGWAVGPWTGGATLAYNIGKGAIRKTWEYLLDKPQLMIKYKSGVDDVKKGDYKAAMAKFDDIKAQVELLEAEQVKPKPKTEEPPIEAKAERMASPEKQSEAQPAAKETKALPAPEEKAVAPVKAETKTIEHRQPKLVEYKPGKATPKQRMESLARESFSRASEGQKISPKEKKLLENTSVALLTTRKSGQQYHGTKKPIKELTNEIYDVSGEQNIFGSGFYTTDALDIADGYSKPKKSKDATVYKVIEKTPQKLYDIEKPLSKEFKDELKYYIDEYGDAKTVREIYDKITDYGEGSPAYEVQETLDGLSNLIARLGYDGISHKGGLLTNNPEHLVKIYWKPENLEIQEFAYPKSFKKVNKSIKPPELPATPTKAKEAPKVTEKKIEAPEPKEVAKKTAKPKKPAKDKESIKGISPTPTKVDESMKEVKHQDITAKGLKEQKQHILNAIEDALDALDRGLKNPLGGNTVIFDIPNDGTFKILYDETSLKKFKALIEKKWPERSMTSLYPKYKISPQELEKHKAKK